MESANEPVGQPSFGNENERVAVKSGFVAAIDQFMLANQQFVAQLNFDLEPMLARERLAEAVSRYGGCLFALRPGDYSVFRDVRNTSIVLFPRDQDSRGVDVEGLIAMKDSLTPSGRVLVDTRCLVLIEQDTLLNKEILEAYQRMWREGRSKQARDFLRENGAAVRYGFSQQSDTLGVSVNEAQDTAILVPVS